MLKPPAAFAFLHGGLGYLCTVALPLFAGSIMLPLSSLIGGFGGSSYTKLLTADSTLDMAQDKALFKATIAFLPFWCCEKFCTNVSFL